MNSVEMNEKMNHLKRTNQLHKKSWFWTLLLWFLPPPSSLSFLTQFISVSSPLSPSPPPSPSLFSHFSTFFLQGKSFHLGYGWLFNAVSPSELEEAWCSACFFFLVHKWIPPAPAKIHTHNLTPWCTTPIKRFLILGRYVMFLSLSK